MTQAQTIDKEIQLAADQFAALPKPDSCRLINFGSAEVRPGIVSGTYILVVQGEAPYSSMQVNLAPLFYIQQPKYWGIEVTGCMPGGIGLPATKPFTVTISLNGTIGTEGIEVIGANGSEKIKV